MYIYSQALLEMIKLTKVIKTDSRKKEIGSHDSHWFYCKWINVLLSLRQSLRVHSVFVDNTNILSLCLTHLGVTSHLLQKNTWTMWEPEHI